MRLDVVTIFPDYCAPLQLSLVGKAVRSGLVALGVHDLRDWTTDRHRTVDDTPYGGGPGLIMRPEPWGAALDDLLTPVSRVVALTPTGRLFTQALAAELADEAHLVLVCGRYEGIDARVVEDARRRARVDEISIGDYVLNGGEAAALVVTEAVVRLLPGVLGNPASLQEESHAPGQDGLLEYPLYTKPPVWRGLAVPDVLRSGHHGEVTAWRAQQAEATTRRVRPDLLPPGPAEVTVVRAGAEDAGELLTLQRAAFVLEARLNAAWEIPPLLDTLDDVAATLDRHTVLVARRAGRLVGAVIGEPREDTWYLGRLMVAPDLQGTGIGGCLLTEIEALAPPSTRVLRMVTGARSAANLALYARRGYREVGRATPDGQQPELVILERIPGGVAALKGSAGGQNA